MAYEKRPIPVLAGGLNLAVPGDTIDDSEAQELVNFATDSYGALRSRKGHTTVCSAGGNVNNLIRALGARWDSAAGSVGKNCGGIISGVSSDFCGLVGFKDFLWAMSPDRQRKSDGANDWRWIPEAPVAAPTTVPASTVDDPLVDMSGGFTVDPAGDENYDAGFLEIRPQQDTAYTAVKGISKDFFTSHSVDDVHRIRVWAKNWDKVNGITFEVDVNTGTFDKDYYRAVMLTKDLNAGRKEDISFYIRKRPLEVDTGAKDKKRYGSFERIGSTPNKDWRSCVKVRLKIDYLGTTKVRFEEWVVVGNAENTLEGDDFRVCYTYTTDAGHESNPSPFSEPITCNRNSINVHSLVPSGDPQVTGMNIYITGGTFQAIYRVNPDPVSNGATDYIINQTNDAITGLAIQLEQDHNDPPAASGIIGPYFNRLVAFGPGNKFFWTHINKPYAFPTRNESDIEDSGDGIRGATMRPGLILFYTTNDVKLLSGDPGDLGSSIFTTGIGMGIASPQGVVKGTGSDYALMSEGMYGTNGSSAEKLSLKLDPIFKGRSTEFVSALGNVAFQAIGFKDNIVWVSDGSQTFKVELSTGRWFQDSRGFTAFYYEGQSGAFLGALTGGAIVALDSGATDSGAAFPIAFTSKKYNAGAQDNKKTWEDFTGWANTSGASLTVTAILNAGEDDQFSVALGSISSSAEERFVLQFNGSLGVQARTCTIRITGNVSAGVVLSKMALNYYYEARDAKSFDSDERDDGTHRVKELLEVYVDLHSPASAQLIIQSDQPGFEMSTRDSAHSFGVSTSRRGDMYVLPSSVLAHNYRLLLNGSDFKLYGMRALLQVIGTFLHGDKAEFYRSDPLDMGTEQVKLYKEIECEYATQGTALLKVETELPNGSIVEVTGSPFTLTGTGGLRFHDVQTRKIRLYNTAKGRLIMTTITPTGDFRLEALRIFYKIVGRPNATPWSWFPFPVQPTSPAIWQEVAIQPDAVG